MREMVICPNCKRVTTKDKIVHIKPFVNEEKGVLDKISGFFFENKSVYRCNDCLNSK